MSYVSVYKMKKTDCYVKSIETDLSETGKICVVKGILWQ